MRHSTFLRTVFVLTAGSALLLPTLARAEADASAEVDFFSLSITPGSGTISASGLQASAFASAGANSQSNSGPTVTAGAGGAFSSATSSATAPGSSTFTVNGAAISGVSIPGATPGSDSSLARSDVTGNFSISGGVGTVNTTFSLPESGLLDVFTDIFGLTANSETEVFMKLDGTTILFDDHSFSILSSGSQQQGFSSTLTTSLPLTYGQVYSFDLEAEALTSASNVPEPGVASLLIVGLGVLGLARRKMRRH